MKFPNATLILIFLAATFAIVESSSGHGFAGARFFPATLSTDDPFVNDELSLPTVSTIKTPEGRETSIAVDIAKRITPNLGIELGESFLELNPNGEHESSGFGNVELGAKYRFFTSEKHETIFFTRRRRRDRRNRTKAGRRGELQHVDARVFLRQRLGRLARYSLITAARCGDGCGRHYHPNERQHANQRHGN